MEFNTVWTEMQSREGKESKRVEEATLANDSRPIPKKNFIGLHLFFKREGQ